jgi:glucose/arabinose dehydrogenase
LTAAVIGVKRASLLRRICSGLALAAVLGAALPIPVQAAELSLYKAGFTNPVFVTNAGDDRLFVVQQGGQIYVLDAARNKTLFMTVATIISKGGERGLLGLAFHPNYATNGLFYIDYTRKSDGATVIAEYHRSASDPNKGDPASARIVLTISQPYANHNGGWIDFGGSYLFIAMGDGGKGGDPGNRAQNKNKLLGKILRINPLDPDGAGAQRYSIPGTNPFVGVDGRDEVWAYGLRNPWRCSLDGGDLWCGDAGQEKYEEVDRIPSGGANLGWRLLEGRHYYNWPGHTAGTLCTSDCKTQPIVEYTHSSGNCVVTGGYVARRSGAARIGEYIYADYCSGKVWHVDANAPVGSAGSLLIDTTYLVSSFGEGDDGRIYLVNRGTQSGNGAIWLVTGS